MIIGFVIGSVGVFTLKKAGWSTQGKKVLPIWSRNHIRSRCVTLCYVRIYAS